MDTNYIIFEDGVHAQVFLVRAKNEEQAWRSYLERIWDYVEQQNGAYCHKPLSHASLQDVFDTYGIVPRSGGLYTTPGDPTPQTLEDVKALYGIAERDDKTFVSHDRCYPNLIEAVKQVTGTHHIEIAEYNLDGQEAFQLLFSSRDKWDYVEAATAEDVKTDIVNEHRWQARRYVSLNKLPEAVAELKKALVLTGRRETLSLYVDIAHLFVELNQFRSAAKHYNQALRVSTIYNNQDQIRRKLAEVYVSLEERPKALWHYRRILSSDPDAEDRTEIERRIIDLQKQAPTVAP